MRVRPKPQNLDQVNLKIQCPKKTRQAKCPPGRLQPPDVRPRLEHLQEHQRLEGLTLLEGLSPSQMRG